MDRAALAKAIRGRASALRNADEQAPMVRVALDDDAELLCILARIVEGELAMGRVFGSPGYWGYSTPIGSALAAPPVERKR